MAGAAKSRVCVTGAGGYIASWMVNLLLSKDYVVHGTVRDPDQQEKYVHLNELEKAPENLKLVKADLLDYNALLEAFAGCSGVFHIASPAPGLGAKIDDPENEILDPAIKGTENVLKACLEAKVKRVVIMSSISAVVANSSWPKGQPKDETCWSDKEFCRSKKNWYFLAKTVAESEAFEFGKRTGLDVVSVCPTVVLGPMMQRNVNFSSSVLINLVKEGHETYGCKFWTVVDVRDLAEAMLMLFEKPEAKGRYLCSSHREKVQDMIAILKKNYPNYNYPTSFKDGQKMDEYNYEKLLRLGWSYRPLEETLIDSIESYKKLGILE